MTVADALRVAAEGRPDAPFLIFRERTWSYAHTAMQARALAVGLHNLGIEQGDRIAIDMPNWPEFVISALAAAELGATIVPLNPGHTPRELQYMLRNSEASVAITAEHFDDVDYLQMFETLLVELPDLQYLVTVGEEDLWYDDRIYQFEDLVASGRGREFAPAEVTSDADPYAILYTPGTTGTPKGVVLTHENLLRTANATAEALSLTTADVTLCAVPLYHIFGLSVALMTAIVSRSALVLQERFDAEEALELIERHRVSINHGVPTMFVMQLRESEEAGRDLSSLRGGIIAGAPVSEELARDVRDRLASGIEIAYGLTETSPTVSITRSDDPPAKRVQTVGHPLPGVEVVIVGENEEALPVESVGELTVRGFNVMQGYFRQPSVTASAMTPDGFLRTGDLAMIDAEGYLHIVGRLSDVIIRGGYNVHPRELEDLLRSHPAVTDAVVLGVPNDVLGELVCACVVPVEGALITAEELRSYCRGSVTKYKVPDIIRLMDDFPEASNQRARRVELARMVRAEVASDSADRG
jgi:fatty-acyl-CoA synthase